MKNGELSSIELDNGMILKPGSHITINFDEDGNNPVHLLHELVLKISADTLGDCGPILITTSDYYAGPDIYRALADVEPYVVSVS